MTRIVTKMYVVAATAVIMIVALGLLLHQTSRDLVQLYQRASTADAQLEAVLDLSREFERYTRLFERSRTSTRTAADRDSLDSAKVQLRKAMEILHQATEREREAAELVGDVEAEEIEELEGEKARQAQVEALVSKVTSVEDPLLTGAEQHLKELAPIVDAWVERERTERAQTFAEADERASSARRFALASAVVGFFVLFVLVFMTVPRVRQGFAELLQACERIGRGDFDVRLPMTGEAEFVSVATAFNKMTTDIQETLKRELLATQHAAHIEAQSQASKMSAVGQLAGGVAHEINNPLGVILGFAQGMERRVPEGDPLRMPVTSIVREAVRCRNLVQELLAFSRTAKKSTEELDLNALVRSSAVLLEARAKTQNVEIIQALEEPLPPLRANKTQLQQVIINLGTNALDAMSGGGKLTLRTKLTTKGTVLLRMEDTGTGIPKELHTRIFEPFFTTKEIGQGTGLGLSLVYEIVHQHEGRISVESEAGEGTVMSVELPAASGQPPAKEGGGS